MKFIEAKLEQTFIELLGNEDFPHYLGNTISRADDEVLIEEDLKNYLHKFVQLTFWPTFCFGVATPLYPKTPLQQKRN